MGIEELSGILKEKDKVVDSKDAQLLSALFSQVKTDAKSDYQELIDNLNVEYERIERFIRNAGLNNEFLNEDSLKDFINAHTNSNFNEYDKILLGLYSGALLSLLTKNNEKEGRRTRFVIDGRKNRFDYLFSCAKNIDELVVMNFSGSEICSLICSLNGSAKSILLNNIQGSKALHEAGSYNGKIERLIFTNSNGWRNLSNVGTQGGHVELIISKDNKGELLGSYIGHKNGQVDAAVFYNNEGNEIGWGFGQYGKVDTVIMQEVYGKDTLNCIFHPTVSIDKLFLDYTVDLKFSKNPNNINIQNRPKSPVQEIIFIEDILKSWEYPQIKEILDLVSKIDSKEYDEAFLFASNVWEKYKDYKIATEKMVEK